MDKYARYLIRQHFLNQMIPPLENHKVFGSHFLYDIMNMYIFFKFKPSNTTNPIEPIKGPDWEEIKHKWNEGYQQGLRDKEKALEVFYNFMNYKPETWLLKLLILPFQLFCKFVVGFIVLFNKKQG